MALIRKKKNIFAEENSRNNLFVGDICAVHTPQAAAVELSSARYWPAEWFTQSGVLIAWPDEQTDWCYMLPEVEETYLRLSYAIARHERLLIAAHNRERVAHALKQRLPRTALQNIAVVAAHYNDTWLRDSGPITLIEGNSHVLLSYRFDGWGGKFEAQADNQLCHELYELGLFNARFKDMDDFTLEGGSIESDGEGTLLTTSACLLNKNRNPLLNRQSIEQRLKSDLNMQQVLWLEHGHLAGDDTDSHIDTLARFCPDGVIAYTQCRDEHDVHYAELAAMEQELQALRNQDGRPYELLPLPLPQAIYANKETGAIVSAEEKDQPMVERLPATYANFLILNHAVLLPTYGQAENDQKAMKALRQAFPEAEIIGINSLSLIKQHGSIHCATMQLPRGVMNPDRFNDYLIPTE